MRPSSRRKLLPPPAHAVFGNFDEHSGGGQFCANGVGGLEIARLTGCLYLCALRSDVSIRNILRADRVQQFLADVVLVATRLRPCENGFHLERVVIPEDGKDFVELVERCEQWSNVIFLDLPPVDRSIRFAYHVKDRGLSLRGVEVIFKGRCRALDRFPGKRGIRSAGRELPSPQAQLEIPQLVYVTGHLLQAVEGEVELVAVGDGGQQQPDRRRLVSLEHQIT